MEYMMVTELLGDALNVSVNEYIQAGWEPYGNPFWNATHQVYCQAMVKYERRD